MSAPHIFKLKYCDENSGWSDKRNGASMSFSAKTLMAMNADLSGMELADVDRLIEYIANNTIAIITAQNISSAQLSRFRSNTLIRKSYGMLETGRAEQQQHDAGLVILVRVGLPADIEAIKMEAKSTRALNILLRVLGVTLAVSVLLVDPSAGQPRRLSALNAVIKSLPQADAVFLVGSLPDNWAQSEEFMHEMQSARINGGFSDPAEEGMERGTYTNATFHAWFKSVKLAAAPTLVECAGRGQEYRHVAITIAARTSLATTIAIPMPRSATTGTSAKSPSASPSAANPILTDPAVLSVEAAKAGGGGSASQSASAELLMRIGRQGQQATPQSPQQPAKWDASHCFLLKGNDTKLNNWEKQLDLSKLFKTTATAVSELNTRFSFWPADYCVVHNTVLCSVAINNNERPTFRRYLRDNSNNTSLHSQLTAALTRYASSRQEKSAWGKPGDGDEVSLLFQRQKKEDGGQQRKEWSDANCTIVYQITPREMKFNVSHYVGMEKGNLATVIQMLNRDKLLSKENALAAYPYDYALLYSMELQAYWLLAASHVPCDIVACRMMAQ